MKVLKVSIVNIIIEERIYIYIYIRNDNKVVITN